MAVLPDQISAADAIPDGIYFDMTAEAYHADFALGSTDIKGLAVNPVSWWFYSKLNPRRPPERDTPALRFGKAVHTMVLEGRKAFELRYAATEFPGNIKAGIAEREAIARTGRIALPREDYDRATIAGWYIREDPNLGRAFQNGHAEVSVFWTRDGIRRKARFDYLKVKSIVDLKSAREQDEMEFDVFCRREIAKRRYYVQVAHYYEARRAMRALWRAGKVSGPIDRPWIVTVLDEDKFYWTWVFYQSSGAPETFGVYTDATRELYRIGERQIVDAEHNYREFSNRFQIGEPWIRVRTLDVYMEDEQPEWVWRR